MSNPFPLFAPGSDWETVQATLVASELSDGLPLVIPTEPNLNQMLGETTHPKHVYGHVPPLFGELTPIAVAYQCVLAGCRPGAMPTIFTGLEASLDDAFNLLGIATTTGTVAVGLIIHGPQRDRLGVNHSTNCLGPGNQANATLGRALSLCVHNIAGAKPGVGDMATMGQPGKYGFCVAEADHDSHPNFLARRERAPDTDAVSVFGASGTLEMLPDGKGDGPERVLDPITRCVTAAHSASGANRKGASSEHLVLLPPECATVLGAHGWTLNDAARYVVEHTHSLDDGCTAIERPDQLSIVITGGPGIKMTYVPLWGGGTSVITRALRDLNTAPDQPERCSR
ncbi:MAG: hypothetical protein AAF493_16675 [Pseudomonadota bacterium]